MMCQLMKPLVENVSKGLLICLSVTLLFSSCSRCEDCELNGNTERICETEFDNPDQYQNALDDREAAGATCTPASF